MKKSLLLIPLFAVMLAGCNGTDGEGGSSETTVLKLDFTSLTAGSEFTVATAQTAFEGCKTAGEATFTVDTISKVYQGNGSGGVRGSNPAGLIKFSTSSAKGSLKLTLSLDVSKVVLNCHSFYGYSTDYPTNTTNFVTVNSQTPVALPYNETGAGEDVTFSVTGKEITIECCNEANTGAGRGIFYTMTFIA